MDKREEFQRMLKEKWIADDPDEIIEVVSYFLDKLADELRTTEPYATNTIRRYEQASEVVYGMLYN